MKHRHNEKEFNENLSPLRGFIHKSVGRPWDKVYSEICTNFDKRKVVNAHILQHLFQYVELEIYIIDGKPHTMKKHRRGEGFEPIAGQRFVEWYVDPRDGILKYNKQKYSKAKENRRGAAELIQSQKAVWRKIDEDNHLFKVNDVWFHYTVVDRPPQVTEYHEPQKWNPPLRGWASEAEAALHPNGHRRWNSLSAKDKEAQGVAVLVNAQVKEHSPPEVPGMAASAYYGRFYRVNALIPAHRYFNSAQTASHKILKAAGLDGTAEAKDDVRMSHREASKYRAK